uniref:hypothetical protein n=1 Tax=Neorhizobium sp. EC2-8 TaxID=3129230 RepID=UPI003101253E
MPRKPAEKDRRRLDWHLSLQRSKLARWSITGMNGLPIALAIPNYTERHPLLAVSIEGFLSTALDLASD